MICLKKERHLEYVPKNGILTRTPSQVKLRSEATDRRLDHIPIIANNLTVFCL